MITHNHDEMWIASVTPTTAPHPEHWTKLYAFVVPLITALWSPFASTISKLVPLHAPHLDCITTSYGPRHAAAPVVPNVTRRALGEQAHCNAVRSVDTGEPMDKTLKNKLAEVGLTTYEEIDGAVVVTHDSKKHKVTEVEGGGFNVFTEGKVGLTRKPLTASQVAAYIKAGKVPRT